ncbi:Hypothetical protein sce6295 [Sorangium cellulosum So ce56]|uniref:DUF4238 domain-containing protein n=1 Tax=Sorangium cellulosum (strain So ce56) TaxID=448385 RepID=A9GJM2_SORC5|nr:DUF4238 domain-containing protein [Sorangium cellulosum]CAN96462.1 Hypothetical protein sce6295 [Sorangium cellulosum So ce56]
MGSTSQPSRRHHYVPQFYLRQWADDDSKLWCYKRERSGKLSETQVAPRATAFQEHLYSVRDTAPFLPERTPDVIEGQFFSPLDNAASQVFQKILSGRGLPLPETEKTTWALFLNSLLERDPRTLATRDEVAPAVAEKVLAELRARCRSAESRARLDDMIGRVDYMAMARNSVREHMVREIRDGDVIEYFKKKSWTIVDVSAETLELITSDSPAVINCGHSKSPVHMLTLALNPSKLFLMQPAAETIDEETLKAIVVCHNLSLLESDGQFLYSRSRLEDGPIIKLRTAAELYFGRSTETHHSPPEQSGD